MADSQEYRFKFFAGNFVFLGILVVILLVVYLLSGILNSWKVDLTADGKYTTSQATKDILGGLQDKIAVTYYSSEDLPSFLQNLRRDTKDLFDEFNDLSKGHFQYSIVNPEEKALQAAEEKVAEYYKQRDDHENKKRTDPPKEPTPPQSMEDLFSGRKSRDDAEIRAEREKSANAIAQQSGRDKKEVEKDLLRDDFKRNYFKELEQRGIAAYPITERQASSVRQVRIYSSIELRYLDKEPEVIPFHYSIESLEYELASRILKLTQDEKPIVAFFDGRKPPMPKFDPMNPMQPPASEYEGIINYLGQFFDVRSIDLKENDSVDDLIVRIKQDRRRKAAKGSEPKESDEDKTVKPEDLELVKVLIVAQPDQLETRQVFEINRAVSLGVPTVFLVSPYSMDISDQGVNRGLPLAMIQPGLDDVFRKWGIEVRKDLLASNAAGSILLPRSMGARGLRMLVEAPLPVNVAAEAPKGIDPTSPLTNRIPQLVFPATTGLRLLAETLETNKLQSTVLARTSPETWSVQIDPFRQSPFNRGQPQGPSVGQYQDDLVRNKDPQEFRDFVEPVPLAVFVRGSFPFTFQGETVPEWRKETKPDPSEGPGGGFPGGGLPPGFGLGGDDESLLLNAEDPAAGAPAPAEPVPATPAPAPAEPAPAPAAPAPAAEPAPAPAAEPAPPPRPPASPRRPRPPRPARRRSPPRPSRPRPRRRPTSSRPPRVR